VKQSRATRARLKSCKKDSRIQSSQFKKRLATLTAELDAKSELIDDLGRQLAEKDRQLIVKSQQIESLDKTVTTLKSEVTSLSQSTASLKKRPSLLKRLRYIPVTILSALNLNLFKPMLCLKVV